METVTTPRAGATVYVLGPTRIEAPTGSHLIRGVQARVLFHLVERDGVPIATEDLIERVWPDPPKSAKTAVQVAVHKLRSALDHSVGGISAQSSLIRTELGYRLDTSKVGIDTQMMVDGLDQARQMLSAGANDEAAEVASRSLRLWGEPFAGITDHPALQAAAHRLHQSLLDGQDLLSETLLRIGDPPSVERLRGLATSEPLRERRWEHLVRGLMIDGRQSEALHALDDARAALGELGLVPGPSLSELEERVRLGDPSVGFAPTAGQGSALLGRSEELRSLVAQALPGRLVSIVGAPGIGKTSLAEAFAVITRSGGKEVVWVSLGGGGDPLLSISDAVLRGGSEDLTGERRVDLLSVALDSESVLILDDNGVEGGLGAAVTGLLDGGLRASIVLATTTPLSVASETVIRLEPLARPEADESSHLVWQKPSMQLFAANARDASDLRHETEAVTEIVQALGGHPMSIILAAGRTADVSVATLRDRLAESHVNTRDQQPNRLHQMVRGAIEDLSDLSLQTLAVAREMQGSWTIADLEVLASPMSVSEVGRAVEDLSYRSLVEHRGWGVYTMLASVRESVPFGLGDSLRRFPHSMADLAENLDGQLRTSEQLDALRRLQRLAPDFIDAMSSAVDGGDVEVAWRLFGSLGHFWWLTQARDEALRWEARIMAMAPADDVKPVVAVKALISAGIAGFSYLRFAEKRERFVHAVEIAAQEEFLAEGRLASALFEIATAFARDAEPDALSTLDDLNPGLEDPFVSSFATFARAGSLASRFDFGGAIRMVNRALGISEEAGLATMESFLSLNLGHLLLYGAEFESARGAYTRALDLASRFEDRGWIYTAGRYGMAEAAHLLGEIDEAYGSYEECVERFRSMGDARGAVLASLRLATILADQDESSGSERQLGFAQSMLRFHEEPALRACVLITEGYLEVLAGDSQSAKRRTDQVMELAAQMGSPLGPLDVRLLSFVESATAAANSSEE